MSKITQLNEKAWAATVGNNHYDFRFEQSKWVDTGKWILVYKSPFIWTNYGKENWDWEIAFEVKPVILGRPEEITEEQAKKIVGEIVDNKFQVKYPDYWQKEPTKHKWEKELKKMGFINAIASFESLLKSKGLQDKSVIILIKQ